MIPIIHVLSSQMSAQNIDFVNTRGRLNATVLTSTHDLMLDIMLTCPCNAYPRTPHFYIVKLGFTVVYIFLIFALKHKLWVFVRTASSLMCFHNLCFEQK